MVESTELRWGEGLMSGAFVLSSFFLVTKHSSHHFSPSKYPEEYPLSELGFFHYGVCPSCLILIILLLLLLASSSQQCQRAESGHHFILSNCLLLSNVSHLAFQWATQGNWGIAKSTANSGQEDKQVQWHQTAMKWAIRRMRILKKEMKCFWSTAQQFPC